MNHKVAVESQAVERFLLDELSPRAQEEFVDHFFGCPVCATDLKSTALFLDTARNVFVDDKVDLQKVAVQTAAVRWHPARYAIAAAVACMCFILYQNILVIPRLKSIATPQALPSFSVDNFASRGGEPNIVFPSSGRPFLLLLDIPPHEIEYKIRVEISSAAGVLALTNDIEGTIAQKTVPFLIPAATLGKGEYILTILGKAQSEDLFIVIQKHPFRVI